jgi:hypothetical protein
MVLVDWKEDRFWHDFFLSTAGTDEDLEKEGQPGASH